MTIKSMTGFARSDGATGSIGWHWEVRSVNGRGLDMRLRLPPGYEALEVRIREAVGKRVVRGNLTINLNVKRSEGETRIKLNESALSQVLAALDSLKARIETAPPRAEALLGIKGVLIYKVGDDFSSIANAARRFLDQQNQMDQRVHNVFAGHLRAIVGNMTVEEMIRFTAPFFPRWRADLEQRYLRKFELPADRKIKALSRGTRTKLALLLALCRGAELLILDEPSMGLDPKTRTTVFNTIRAMNDAGHTLLLVEQNARSGLGIATHGVVMESGRIRLEGPGPEVLSNPEIGRLYLGAA